MVSSLPHVPRPPCSAYLYPPSPHQQSFPSLFTNLNLPSLETSARTCNPCFAPHPTPRFHSSWNALLDPYVALEPRFDLSLYHWYCIAPQICDYDWKIFQEYFADDYHIQTVHPDLHPFLDLSSLEWITPSLPPPYRTPISHGQRVLQSSSCDPLNPYLKLESYAPHPDRVAAFWVALYPHLMIEYFSGMLTLSWIQPSSPGTCINSLLFGIPLSIPLSTHPQIFNLLHQTYLQTAIEDDLLAFRMQSGRQALAPHCTPQNCTHYGPIHPRFEFGQHVFYQFLDP